MDSGKREIEIPKFMQKRKEIEIPEFMQNNRENIDNFNFKITKEETKENANYHQKNSETIEIPTFMNRGTKTTNYMNKELDIPSFINERQEKNKNNQQIKNAQEHIKNAKRVKANKEISTENYFFVKISKNRLKILLAALAVAAITFSAGKVINKNIEEHAFIESTIENDDYLDSIVIYNNDADPNPELRISNPEQELQVKVSTEEVAEYISEMDNLTDEQKEHLMNYYGVELPKETSNKSR